MLRGKQHNNVHVSFDETNPLIEHDIQDEEFKNDLVRKDLSLTQNSMVDNDSDWVTTMQEDLY